MTEPLKVLVWGNAVEGPCAYFRGYMYDEPLKELGVEMRHLSKMEFKRAKGWEDRDDLEAFAAGKVELDTTDIEWADVMVFRRYYNTTIACVRSNGRGLKTGCGFQTRDEDAARRHEHQTKQQDNITRLIWPLVSESYSGGLIYETDDNHFEIKNWNGYYGDVLQERDLIADMARRADLMTTSTPDIAKYYSRFNSRVRVVRNAIDPRTYQRTAPRPEGDKPRLVYYGSTARLRDYLGYPDERGKHRGGYAHDAVDAHRALVRRIFLGTNPGTERVVEELFDEQHPYVDGNINLFNRTLANLHGDIGIAPLGGDDFDKSKSELHWLEYAITEMAFIGERYNGDGPYQVVRPGVDGLLARGAQEWHDSVGKLAKSRDLREQLAGAAKERVLAEYDFRQRAVEWRDAYAWAAENAGIGKRAKAAA